MSSVKLQTVAETSPQSAVPIRRKFTIKGPGGTPTKLWVTVKHERDPKQVILDSLGKLPDEIVQFSQILVAVYAPPVVTKTDSGLLLLDKISEEDVEEYKWQGKVGLVVAMGPQAYVDDENTKFHGTKNKIGDWVWFRASDGLACEVNGAFCRKFNEAGIIGKVEHPDQVW